MKRRYSLGLQSSSKIRGDGYVYVDKPRYIFKMVDTGTYYFLSHPRRFGKSLLVSTLKSFFEGRKDLLQGLWIEKASLPSNTSSDEYHGL